MAERPMPAGKRAKSNSIAQELPSPFGIERHSVTVRTPATRSVVARKARTHARTQG